MKRRNYQNESSKLEPLSSHLYDWLSGKGFETQYVQVDDKNKKIIQAKKGNLLQKATGLSKATTIILGTSGNTLEVQVGAGQWMDKAAVGAVSMVVLWPLMLTAGLGVWQQTKFFSEVWEKIEDFLKLQSTKSQPQRPINNIDSKCPSCGFTQSMGSKYCSNCGANMVNNTCPICMQLIKPDSLYCQNCGNKIT